MIDLAIKAIKKAAKITSANFGNFKEVNEKARDREVVTEIDIEAEKKIKEIILAKFPNHGFLGEEGGLNKSGSEYLWVVDPLDGTVNYSRGLKKYGISLALAKSNDVILGVVYNPVADEMFIAERGKGAFLNGQPIKVNQNKDLFQSVIYVSELYKSKEVITGILEKVKNLRVASSSAYDICMVACGRTEAFIKITSHPWGFAAANLIVEEAGGKVTNLDGSSWDINSTKMLIYNKVLHGEILSLLN